MQDRYGDTLLHHAARQGFDCVQILLDYGAEIDTKNKEGKTPVEASENERMKNLIRAHGKKPLTSDQILLISS